MKKVCKMVLVVVMLSLALAGCGVMNNGKTPADTILENNSTETETSEIEETETETPETETQVQETVDEAIKGILLDAEDLERLPLTVQTLDELKAMPAGAGGLLDYYSENTVSEWLAQIQAYTDENPDVTGKSEVPCGQTQAMADYTYLREGDFIWVMIPVDAGMSKSYFVSVRSMDGGESWAFVNGVTAYAGGVSDVAINSQGLVALTYGYAFYWSPIVVIDNSADTHSVKQVSRYLPESYKQLDCVSGQNLVVDEEGSIGVKFYASYEASEDMCLVNARIADEDILLSYPNNMASHVMDYFQSKDETEQCFADSDEMALLPEDLMHLYDGMVQMADFGKAAVAKEIRYAINEIYARRGYDFSGTEYRDYFAEKDWYEPVPGKTIKDEDLSPVEKANIDLLVNIEKDYQ